MDKKGQLTGNAGLGEIVIIFVAIIIGIAMIGQVFETQNVVTQKQAVVDESYNLGAGCYAYNITGAPTANWEVNVSNPKCNITVSKWYSSGDWRISDSQCHLSGVVVTNTTGTLTLVASTDYNLHEGSGIIQMLLTKNTNSSALEDNLTATDYSYCGFGYNPDASSRGIANLWGIFGALIILGAAVYGIRRWIS